MYTFETWFTPDILSLYIVEYARAATLLQFQINPYSFKSHFNFIPEAGLGIEKGRSVSPPAGETPAKEASAGWSVNILILRMFAADI